MDRVFQSVSDFETANKASAKELPLSKETKILASELKIGRKIAPKACRFG